MFQGSYHTLIIWAMLGFYRLPQWLSGKESLAVQETQEMQVWSLGQEILWRRKWQSTPVFLPGEFHEQKSLVGYSPQTHKELDTTEWLTLSHYILPSQNCFWCIPCVLVCCVSTFASFKVFFISLLISSLATRLFRSMNFPVFLLLLILSFIPFWSEKILRMIPTFLNLLTCFVTCIIYPTECSICSWEECVFCCWVECSIYVCLAHLV